MRNQNTIPKRQAEVIRLVERKVNNARVFDIHTHLYDPAFGQLLLWGIDDLLVYHYLVSEAFRFLDLPAERFWQLSKSDQADLVWKTLFIDHSPISEACRGVLTVLNTLGLDVKKRDLPALRRWFANWKPEAYVDRCLEVAKLRAICMTNSPFDSLERPVWEKGFRRDARFKAALRIDPLLMDWPDAARQLVKWGYRISEELNTRTVAELRRFLTEWCERINALYLMVSLPPDFSYPGRNTQAGLIEKAVLPFCREAGLPFAVMLGVKRAVNPALRLAGDGVGLSNLDALEALCSRNPENKFMATALSRENQHTLCVITRKFRNLHLFGCWWFTNVPALIEEITLMRTELLGLSFTPQHSDSRVLDQIIYKWEHSRPVIGKVLARKYAGLVETGWEPSEAEIDRDVAHLFGGALEDFCGEK